MRVYAKVRVNFVRGCLVDFDQLVHDLRSEYNIGFVGFFKAEECVSVFIQRKYGATRMALAKVKKICTKVADVVGIGPFDTCQGEYMDSFGDFRPRGAKERDPVLLSVKPTIKKRTLRGVSKDEELFVIGGKAYACREIPLPKNTSTFCAVYGSYDGTWTARFWVGPVESLGRKDKKRVTDDQRAVLLERQGHLCQECSCTVAIGSYSNADVDHIIPRSLGGKTVLSNLQIICVPCHRTKTGLECKGVKKVFPFEFAPSDSMYAVANDGSQDVVSGDLNPLEFMRKPVGIVAMNYTM